MSNSQLFHPLFSQLPVFCCRLFKNESQSRKFPANDNFFSRMTAINTLSKRGTDPSDRFSQFMNIGLAKRPLEHFYFPGGRPNITIHHVQHSRFPGDIQPKNCTIRSFVYIPFYCVLQFNTCSYLSTTMTKTHHNTST